MPGAKNFTVEDKRVAIGLWKGGLPLSKIREQLQMSKASLKRILATARKNPTLPVAKRKVGTGRKSTINQEILRLMRKKLVKDPTLSAKQLRASIPGLQHLKIRQIQKLCQKDLALPCRKMANKPLLTEAMKEKRLAFANQYGHWTVDQWKKDRQLTDCNATSLPALQLEITRLWVTRMENSDYLRSLVESMPRRLQEVISKAGNTTKY